MARPFTTFNFKVLLQLPAAQGTVCDAEFSECDGLELSHEPKTIREGGNNRRQIHLAGPVSYGQLTLKRGMTSDFGLWRWFERVHDDRALRASGEVRMLSSGRGTTDVRFSLTGCLPVKVKAPSLNAKDGGIAIEEMQIAYETLRLAE
ncbi:MAG: phage tail protein [Thermoanaerobaculia bacterium]|nr:phage tail protein [Thermoanaerobaculia bacterium]